MKRNIKIAMSVIMITVMLINLMAIGTFSSGVNEIALATESVSGEAGATVSVDITIEKNTGVSFLKFSVAYSEHLILTNVTLNHALAGKDGITAPTPYKNPQTISMISALSEVKDTGHIATLTFKIADDAPDGVYPLSIDFDEYFTINGNLDPVTGSATCGSVTVGAAASSLSVETYLDCEYEVSGRVVTVSNDAPCKVGYKSGVRYIALDALPNADGSYSFTAPDGVSEVLLVLKGDANLDGRVTAADLARINASKLGKTTITSDAIFAGDVDRNSALNDSDIDTIKNAVLRISPLEW